MGRKPVPWPSHGKAVEARNTAASSAVAILEETRRLRALLEDGSVTRLDVLITLNRVDHEATTTLLNMIEQGAPFLKPEQRD